MTVGASTAVDACDRCLRRGYLVGRLAGRIAGLLDRPRRTAGVLALDDADLVAAVAGEDGGAIARFLEAFDAAGARVRLERGGVRAICHHAAGYPEQLASLVDAPPVLFLAGRPGAESGLSGDPSVTIVGTRRPSPHGRAVAYELGRGLATAGVAVVSGLALGIDADAHRGALAAGSGAAAGAPPIAVLACGPDIAYPRTNRGLYARVRERGIVVSELPPGQRPYRWSFPARNRIMAGLGAMTVVVEAADPSGSLITSEFATDLGRPIGAVPGQVTAAVASGSNRLLKDGGRVITCVQDVLDELYGVGSPGPRAAPLLASAGGAAAGSAAASAAGSGATAGLDPIAARLLEAVEAGLGIAGICGHAGLPVREVRAGLSRLEASGHVGRDPLGAYRRTLLAR